jgi:hypothetical protein
MLLERALDRRPGLIPPRTPNGAWNPPAGFVLAAESAKNRVRIVMQFS